MSYDPVNTAPTPNLQSSFEDDHEAAQLQPPAGFRDSGNYRESYGEPSNLSFDSSKPFSATAGGAGINAPYRDDPLSADAARSTALLSEKENPGMGYPPSSPPMGDSGIVGAKKSKRPWIIGGAIGLLAIIAVAVAVPVALHSHNSSSASSSGDHGGSSSGGGGGGGGGNDSGLGTSSITMGGDGSTVTMEDGTTFVYNNSFGGFWVQDANDPFNGNAQAQSWSPPLNQSWDWQNDKIRGVNLGGWLVPEPFIVPALFEPYLNAAIPARDEWTLSQNMAADTANGGLAQLETHYKTFITEKDFAEIAAAGLNWVRLPIPFWVIQKYDNEPFLEGVAWKYVLKAFAWARKYGLRINLDLHTFPGSQNGYNHSGKSGMINFMMGSMGIANAQRGLEYQRIIVEFISQPEYENLVPLFGVVNEVRTKDIGIDVMTSFYLHMHQTLRNITGIGKGKGPYLAIHDGFQPLSTWANFLRGNDRLAMDTHPYMCFAGVDPSPLASQAKKPCRSWANEMNTSVSNFGVTTAGEWSLAVNDCGYWVNGVNAGTRWEGTLSSYSGPNGGQGPNGCNSWNDYTNWDQTMKTGLTNVALASMDALQNWFFWTWKIGASSTTGVIGSPLWSYQLGLENGYMPTDPRAAVGVCGTADPATPYTDAMLGGAGAGDFSQAVLDANPWPPASILADVAGGSVYSATDLPSYTQTGPIPTLPTPTFTNAKGAAVDGGNGWANAADSMPIYTPIAGCTYPDAWDSQDVAPPQACGATPSRRFAPRGNVAFPKRTPAP